MLQVKKDIDGRSLQDRNGRWPINTDQGMVW